MFIVTADPDGEPDRKVFSDLVAAKHHAEMARAKRVATTIHEVDTASAREAIELLASGKAALIEARSVDISAEEKRRRVEKKRGDDLMAQLW